ncbi:arsenite efflux transporter metallochaperone ArsD [Methanosarcina sp. UBA5]|uniref:arsenite efflux transporter metallochaperone ArsD n=1 Tax=Methanosarcina sp. UBA5 TaxID=1915593 RepID=UPI0025E9E39E|nr:arsenite efflux transporter metallochaperone ArsD [Methanosarcina sp. UBA5]
MTKMIIFDPAMCCSTGLCGPVINPELLRISTALNNLEKNGVKVERYNLNNNPQAFVDNVVVSEMLNRDGVDVLPVTVVDGKVVKTKSYPTNNELLKFLDIPESYLKAKKTLEVKDCDCGDKCCSD